MALVYDVSQPQTIEHLPDWVHECRSKAPNIPVLVVASKIDLPHKVPVSKIARWAADNGYDYIETSAKNKFNVEAMFEKLGTLGVNFALKSR
jgi:signal recognition particle receptor subunit beta